MSTQSIIPAAAAPALDCSACMSGLTDMSLPICWHWQQAAGQQQQLGVLGSSFDFCFRVRTCACACGCGQLSLVEAAGWPHSSFFGPAEGGDFAIKGEVASVGVATTGVATTEAWRRAMEERPGLAWLPGVQQAPVTPAVGWGRMSSWEPGRQYQTTTSSWAPPAPEEEEWQEGQEDVEGDDRDSLQEDLWHLVLNDWSVMQRLLTDPLGLSAQLAAPLHGLQAMQKTVRHYLCLPLPLR